MTNLLGNTRKPDITFYKNGRIDITARVAKALELSEGDVIDVAMERHEYLLYIKYHHDNVVGRHEAQCRETKRGLRKCNNIRTYSKRLTDAILQASGTDLIARLPVGAVVQLESGITAIPIITRNPLSS